MEQINSRNKNWIALYTKPRHEFKAALQLDRVGVEYYLPTIIRLKQWSDRKKKVEEPIFRGYIFVKCNEKERLLALEQTAVVKTIFFDGKPAIVPEWQIESLRKMLEGNPEVTISDQLKVGSRVKIITGPFSGVEGVVYQSDKAERMLAITIELLKRSVIVRLSPESVVKKV